MAKRSQSCSNCWLATSTIPGRFDGAPALLKLGGIGFAEMGFGVALHMHGAELNVGIGEQALGDGEQSGKIILHQEEDAAQTAFEQVAQHSFPVFEIFAAGAGQAGEDLLSAIAAQADDDVDAGGTQTIAVAKLDIFAIEEQSQQIGIERSAVAQF